MQGIEILLVILGIVFIFISYIISERITNRLFNSKTQTEVHNLWSEKEEYAVKEQLNVIVTDKVEDTVVRVDDQLSQISNEKIIAVSEFSDQILEKINQNHTEVVFLYNMLNEKENEIKTLINQIDSKKAKLTDEINIQESISETDSNNIDINNNKAIDISLESVVEPWNEMGKNNNDQIIKLYKSGKSVIEIAKMLDLGQGEVKLVIDLSRGVKS